MVHRSQGIDPGDYVLQLLGFRSPH